MFQTMLQHWPKNSALFIWNMKKKLKSKGSVLGWLFDHLNCSLSQHRHVQWNWEPWLKTPFKWISIYSWFLAFSAIRYAHLCLNNTFSVLPFSTSFSVFYFLTFLFAVSFYGFCCQRFVPCSLSLPKCMC